MWFLRFFCPIAALFFATTGGGKSAADAIQGSGIGRCAPLCMFVMRTQDFESKQNCFPCPAFQYHVPQ